MRSIGLSIYAILLLVWTWLLVKPEPVPESLVGGVPWFDPVMLNFYLAKATHFSVYAGFAFLGGYLLTDRRLRIALWIALVVHGIASEVGQMVGEAHFDTKRHGCVRDMLIDLAGVAAGAILVGRWRKSRPRA